jgi:predicted TIM-barrel fold metal-dependent hydrolase
VTRLSRRELLTGVAALGLAGLPEFEAAAAPARARTLIDFHLHFNPNAPAPVAGRGGGTPSGRGGPRSLQQVLDMMDEGGVAIGLISQGGGAAADSPAAAAKATRELNDAMAKTIADNPGRFGMFANLPLPYIDVSLREMEYAIRAPRSSAIRSSIRCSRS